MYIALNLRCTTVSLMMRLEKICQIELVLDLGCGPFRVRNCKGAQHPFRW